MKKLIAKILIVTLSLCLCIGCFSGCTARENILKILNWEDYMDENTIPAFQQWYLETYGTKIKVEVDTFISNEDAYRNISIQKMDYDLVCPSDYMMDRMKKEELLLPIDKNVIDIEKDNLLSPTMLSLLNETLAGSAYAVPYVWGTFGIMYDTKYIDTVEEAAKMKSWNALWDSAFQGAVYMKDQERDSYAVATLYANREQLKTLSAKEDKTEYRALLNRLFKEVTPESIDAAEIVLRDQKSRMKTIFESDDGKIFMNNETKDGKLGLFWSCDAGFAMNDFEREGMEYFGNKNLRYVVPDEGSNVWIDAWVIPKHSGNTVAANRFLQFVCSKDIARKNAEYAGSQTCNQFAMAEMKADLDNNTDGYFDDAPEGFKEMYLNMMFPSETILSRCAVMADFGDQFDNVTEMFLRVKRS